MLYFKLFLLALIVVMIIDISGFVNALKKALWRLLMGKGRIYREYRVKPFDCSFCMTHHVCLLYIIIIGEFSLLTWAYIFMLAFFTPLIKDCLILVRDILGRIISWCFEHLT